MYWELGWGSASTPVVTVARRVIELNSGEIFSLIGGSGEPCDIPAGATVYVRAVTSAASAETNITASAIGVY
jgi:hypothetical protein